MKPEDFQPGRASRLRKLLGGASGYWAFVPAPLPPAIEFTQALACTVSAADRALGLLAGVGKVLPNPHLLIGPFKRVEAVLSSRIEGTHASLSDLVLFEAAPQRALESSDAGEVLNYIKALDHGIEQQRVLPLSLRLIRDMHRILMDGVRGQERAPGEFRTSQNWIGHPGCTLNEASFVPPPPEEMNDALGAFERFLHTPSMLPPIVRLAMVHYQFEAIHPFLDGNGRIGRLLIPLILCLDQHLPAPLLYLSAFFERHRSEYYERLLKVSTEGDWAGWIDFFARGVAHQASDAVDRAQSLFALREQYRQSLMTPRSSGLLPKLIDELFDRPWLDVATAARNVRVTPAAAQRLIDRLVEHNVLVEVTGWKRNRLYVATHILEVANANSEFGGPLA